MGIYNNAIKNIQDVERRIITKSFNQSVSKYSLESELLDSNPKSTVVRDVTAYNARYWQPWSKKYWRQEGLSVVWSIEDVVAQTFEDTFDRPDGAVLNGWTTATDWGGNVQIHDQQVLMSIPDGIGGNWLPSVVYRPNILDGGNPADALDGRPLNIYCRIRLIGDSVGMNPSLRSNMVSGVWFYWNTPAMPPSAQVGFGLSCGNEVQLFPGNRFVVEMMDRSGEFFYRAYGPQWTQPEVYVRLVLKQKSIEYWFSTTGRNDDWKLIDKFYTYVGLQRREVPEVFNREYHPTKFNAPNICLTPPTHFILGRGCAGPFQFLQNFSPPPTVTGETVEVFFD